MGNYPFILGKGYFTFIFRVTKKGNHRPSGFVGHRASLHLHFMRCLTWMGFSHGYHTPYPSTMTVFQFCQKSKSYSTLSHVFALLNSKILLVVITKLLSIITISRKTNLILQFICCNKGLLYHKFYVHK